MVIALKLASSKWWGGDPEKILAAPADAVMNAMHYDTFKAEYELEMIRLNKPEADS